MQMLRCFIIDQDQQIPVAMEEKETLKPEGKQQVIRDVMQEAAYNWSE